MNRRRFLQLTAISTLPAWMAGCYSGNGKHVAAWAPDDTDGDSPEAVLRRAWHAAALKGQPLLVIEVPRDDAQRQTNAKAWGELLNHGTDSALAALAVCELACGDSDSVRVAFSNFAGMPAGEVGALLIETHEPRIVAIRLDIADIGHAEFGNEGPYVEQVNGRMNAMGTALAAAISTGLERRAERAAAAAGAPARVAPRRVDVELVKRAPAVALFAAHIDDHERARIERLLAEAAAERLRGAAPANAAWAISTGCGCEIEGAQEDSRVACGMGHVPEVSQRFLAFYNRV